MVFLSAIWTLTFVWTVSLISEMVKNNVSDLQHIDCHTSEIPFPAPAELLPAATTDECGVTVGKQNRIKSLQSTLQQYWRTYTNDTKNLQLCISSETQLHSPSLSRAGPPKAKPAPIPPGLLSTDVLFFLLAVKWEGDWRDLLFVPCSIIKCEHLEQNGYWYELLQANALNKALCFHNTTSAVHFHFKCS